MLTACKVLLMSGAIKMQRGQQQPAIILHAFPDKHEADWQLVQTQLFLNMH